MRRVQSHLSYKCAIAQIDERLLDFFWCVHNERAIWDNGFLERRTGHQHEAGMRASSGLHVQVVTIREFAALRRPLPCPGQVPSAYKPAQRDWDGALGGGAG